MSLLAVLAVLAIFPPASAPTSPAPNTTPENQTAVTALEADNAQEPPCKQSENPKACNIKWRNLLLQTAGFNAVENVGNTYTGYWYRWETTHGKWFDRYANTVQEYRYWRWSDDNPLLDDYVGHPMMGSITQFIYLNNDPRANYFDFENSRRYWKARLKAFAYSAAYSTEWKIGPLGEAGIGFSGDHYYVDRNKYTNGTGFVSLVTTPVGGLLWTTTEDYLDAHLVRRLERDLHGPVYLTMVSFLTPAHGFANLLALKAPWARTSRNVRSTWGVRDAETPEGAARNSEVGVWAGGSWIPGSLLGSADDYSGTFNVRYSRLLTQHGNLALRYAGDLNGSVISEPNPNVQVHNRFNERRRVYGTGISPLGAQLNFLAQHKVQPFVDAHGGATYFLSKLSGPSGTTVNLNFDTGVGLQVVKQDHRSVTVGYRYQHFASTNFGGSAPGIDSNTVFVGVSMFR
ncbi:MAG: acyloxyacyl hydrolase [Acidobacteriales bacterium]|nr:acyloxyacyl hydrolase [Terriglobales bacterium]